jgi:hypothetical protein
MTDALQAIDEQLDEAYRSKSRSDFCQVEPLVTARTLEEVFG